jgi:hypothetical protein
VDRKRAGEILCPVTVEHGHGLRDKAMAEARESRVHTLLLQPAREVSYYSARGGRRRGGFDSRRDGTTPSGMVPDDHTRYSTTAMPHALHLQSCIASHLPDDDFDLVESLSDFGAFSRALNQSRAESARSSSALVQRAFGAEVTACSCSSTSPCSSRSRESPPSSGANSELCALKLWRT